MMPYSCGYFLVTKDFVHSDCLCTLLQCLEDVEEDANVFILQWERARCNHSPAQSHSSGEGPKVVLWRAKGRRVDPHFPFW